MVQQFMEGDFLAKKTSGGKTCKPGVRVTREIWTDGRRCDIRLVMRQQGHKADRKTWQQDD